MNNVLKSPGGSIDLQIVVNHNPITIYHHEHSYFIEGREGSDYKIKIRSNVPYRMLAVVTVDGLSVTNGQSVSLETASEHPGYILGGFGYMEIPGWRIDNSKVAKFTFGKVETGYASRMEKGGNAGIIGFAAFKEVHKPSPYLGAERGGVTRGISIDKSLGILNKLEVSNSVSPALATQWGEQAEHKVQNIEFKAESNPLAVLQLYYDNRENLISYGIDMKPVPMIKNSQAFQSNQEVGCPIPA